MYYIFFSCYFFWDRVAFNPANSLAWNYFKNKIFYQNKFIIIFKKSTPFEFCIKMTAKFMSELEISERFTTAISGISVKKVTSIMEVLKLRAQSFCETFEKS